MKSSRYLSWSFSLLLPVILELSACTEDASVPEGAAGATGGCTTNAQCGAGRECSGGQCVMFATCGSAASACATGQSCVAGICRTTCTTDAECQAQGLVCDEPMGHCVPAPNPMGSGGSAGASGGSAGAGGTPPSSGGSGGSSTPTEMFQLIDDLEDGDSSIIPTAGRNGKWSFYNPDGHNVPGGINQQFSTQDPGANGTLYAVKSNSSSGASYAGVQLEFSNPGDAPTDPGRQAYDVSAWDGVTFWARANSDVTRSLRVEFPTREVAETSQQGTCTGSGCFDSYGMEIVLDSNWQSIRVPFADLVQEGWGQIKEKNLTAVFGIAFEYLNASSNFDFSVDQVGFYKDAPSTGTGGSGAGGSDGSGGSTAGSSNGGSGGSSAGTNGSGGNSGGSSGGSGGSGGSTGGNGTGTCQGDYWGGYNDGSITYYTFAMGSTEVNCSYSITGNNPDTVAHVTTGNGQHFGAMNTADYNNAAMCGACVEVSRDDGRKVTVTIVDQCPIGSNPKCTTGHIDLSRTAFQQLATESEGYVGSTHGGCCGRISWRYVPCNTTGNVSFKVKEPSNQNWNMVLVQGHRYPIKSVTIGGANASRQSYNYWLPPGGVMGNRQVVVTDINNSTISGTVQITGGDQNSGAQFVCQ